MRSKRRELLSGRSGAQLRLAYDRLVRVEGSVRHRVPTYMGDSIGWELPAPRPPSGKAGSKAAPLAYGPPETFGYVSRRLLPKYVILHRVLDEAREHLPDFSPRSMLDFGSGPGTAVLAAGEVWGPSAPAADDASAGGGSSGLRSVRVVDRSQPMLDAAQAMLSGLESRGVSVGYGSSLLAEARSSRRSGHRFDLVVAANVLSELSTHEARAAAAAVLWDCVAPDGLLVVVDRGDARGSHTVRSARKLVLEWTDLTAPPSLGPDDDRGRRRRGRGDEDSGSSGGGGWSGTDIAAYDNASRGGEGRSSGGGSGNEDRLFPTVVAPCRHDGACPLALPGARSSPCLFRQRVPAPMEPGDALPGGGGGGGGSGKGVGFSYVILRKRNAAGAAAAAAGPAADGERRGGGRSPVEILRAMERGRLAGGLEAMSRELALLEEQGELEEEREEQDGEDKGDDATAAMAAAEEEEAAADGGGGGDRRIIDMTAMVRGDWSRLVAPPLKGKRLVSLSVCTPAGTLEKRLIGKRRWRHIPGFYITARKTELGALWPEL
ncbi:unnamed protein product [Phaeothamnion confervicola]